MLEEIIALFLSFFSLFTSETPRVSFRHAYQTSDNNSDELRAVSADVERWRPYINKEYEDVNDPDQSLTTLITNHKVRVYNSFGNENAVPPGNISCWKSFRKSLITSFSVTSAIIPLTAITMAFLYLDLNTTDICVEWEHHNNSLSLEFKRIRVIGDSVEAIITNLWFPVTIAVLFGWKVFKRQFMSTFYIALVFGEAVIIYYLFLLSFGLYDTQIYYRYPANFLFFTGIIMCCIVVICNIRARGDFPVTYSNGHIFALVSTEFLVASALSYIYRYVIVPNFNQVQEESYKFMIAASAPVTAIIPALVCKHIALRRSSEVVHPGRSFVLAYFIRGGVIFLYRTMQEDLKNLWFFVGLSLLSAVLNFVKKATLHKRMILWKCIITRLQRTACCRRLKEMPSDTAHYRRLKADLEIQDMLFEHSTLVLSQGYFVLYFVESFAHSPSDILYESAKRVAIGIGIDVFFNCLSNFVQIHYYNIPVGRVWAKYWKRHMLANLILVLVIVSYFSPILLSVFQARQIGANNRNYVARNCTL